LGDDAVVGVEGFVDGDGDGDGGGGDVGLGCRIVLVGFVVAWTWVGRLGRGEATREGRWRLHTDDECVFRELFHEAPRRCCVHVEVEGVCGEDEGERGCGD